MQQPKSGNSQTKMKLIEQYQMFMCNVTGEIEKHLYRTCAPAS